jgi:class 3 adenylate cyclase/putative methionine-R-sulfoxide reductase with GAF domain
MSAGNLQKKVDTLTHELTEAREQQTATANVLKVISRSTFDVQKVLDTLTESACRLCDASDAVLLLREGNFLRFAAHHGSIPIDFTEWKLSRAWVAGRSVLDRKPIHVHDLLSEKAEFPVGHASALRQGHRTIVAVPLMREQEVIGAINMRRTEVRPFTDKQIALIETFADQAVIAIENARLLNELRQRTDDLSESLEQQTATSEVLKVISSSPGQLKPVFETMLAYAVRICEAKFGTLFLCEGDDFRVVAEHNTPPALVELHQREPTIRVGPSTSLYRSKKAKQPIQIADLTAEPAYCDPNRIALVELGGYRGVLSVPMVKEGEVIGAINMYRQDAGTFSDNQVELVKNFAAQAVIAIENTRLLDDLNKLNQQLEQRVADQVNEIERMSRLRRFLPPQVADLIIALGAEKQLESHRREITALFCDLRGFTGFSEASAPEDVMALLRDYHAAIGETIIKYSGTLERYAGDGVMVVFNDPVPVDNPALRAVLMALETREAMGVLMEKWRQLGHGVGFGIGIAHGFATLGTIGFEGRFDYAAIGTVSNVASRLCDEAKPGQILISPRVFTAVKDAVTVELLGEFTLKGIGRPLAAYNVLGAKPPN